MSQPVIQVKDLVKRFRETTAVDGVSFDVREGEVFGFLGPNGAGKSTTISIICTILKATAGEVLVNGLSVLKEKAAVRRSVGIIFQDPTLDNNLTVRENLRLHARLYHLPPREIRPRLEAALALVALADRQKSLVRTLSGGMKRRVEIARGMLHEPAILFLDEPTIGLDPQTRQGIWEYVLALRTRRRMTMFLTTHYLEEAEYCDRIAIIDRGRIIALDTPANLKRMVQGDRVELVTRDPDRACALLAEQTDFAPEVVNGRLRLTVLNSGERIPLLFKLLGDDILELDVKKTSLDDVFIRLTGREIREADAGAHDRLKHRARMMRKI
jgi:ABC-2 type transport system ATP-binding protein